MAEPKRRRAAAPAAPALAEDAAPGAPAVLHISSRNYSSWSMRGFLLCRMAGIPFTVRTVDPEDPGARAELLLQSSSILLPCLSDAGAELWDTLAIAEYLNERYPERQMMPAERLARARCRAISGEMHAGFAALRSTLPLNLRAHIPDFTIWSAARADIDRILKLWRDCLAEWGGPWLFGAAPSVADAMFAPVVCRFRTYDVALDGPCEAYARIILAWAPVQEWMEAALREPEPGIAELDLDAEF
ncbi:glutathione S-transferase [Siccirubricoccus sp. KC 17139]|uniref:Glutathione S-transferase n=1 Tax=Siccirubricoccus soli TaxID=2899147 RepID=A0ABT1D0Q2_9PROT|nr:glutathione S-transferase [Siccirubricoccus soli]MCO6415483.1 glutathione S-transferase [Siccirubricoccus soli]MCP2681615.1 glutathione S-transferase [Siccirubricoccus soli]